MIPFQSIFFQLILLMVCTTTEQTNQNKQADITKVTVSGSENNFTFSVTISSPDKGCDQYADWWEVVSESGDLLYRRVLRHSHVSEQPFTRSGGPVQIAKDQVVWVRAHMNNTGYGGATMSGSVENGFKETDFPEGLDKGLDQVKPLPSGCAF